MSTEGWTEKVIMTRTKEKKGLLELRTVAKSGKERGLVGGHIILQALDNNPLVWGAINGTIPEFDSREELFAILRAASYALGIPRAEERRMQALIGSTGFVEHRTAYEDAWRKALFLGARTEEHDAALIALASHVERIRRTDGGRECSLPISLDPDGEKRGVPGYGLLNAVVTGAFNIQSCDA